MPELDAATMDKAFTSFSLNDLNLSAVANEYSVEELIRAFLRQREELRVLLNDLDDEQVNYNPDPENFSISEIISHIVTSQNGTYNALLELSNIVLPFLDHVSYMPGAGAKKHLTAKMCQQMLNEATEDLSDIMRQSARIEHFESKEYPGLGTMNLNSWIVFQLGHDLDHLRQTKSVLHSEGFPRVTESVTSN